MATSPRLTGRTGLYLSLKKGSAAAFTTGGDDLKKWTLAPADAEASDLTFYEALQGLGKEWTLTLEGIVSFAAGSLWMWLWANAGGDPAAMVLGPAGNAAAAAGKPIFNGSVAIDKPGLENEARTTKEGAPFTVELKLDGDPVMVTA